MDSNRKTSRPARIRMAVAAVGSTLVALGAVTGTAFADTPPHDPVQIDKIALPPPNPGGGGVIGDAIAFYVCPDGTVVEYDPGKVSDPEALCPPVVNPGIVIPDLDFGICILPTHGGNPCDADDKPDLPEIDPTRDECGDPSSFESYQEFADSCVLVECLDGAFPNEAVPLILCFDDGDLCTHLDDYDSFEEYFEACFGEPDDEPVEVPEDRPGDEPVDEPEGGDEPPEPSSDGDEPANDGDDEGGNDGPDDDAGNDGGDGQDGNEPADDGDEPGVEQQVDADVDVDNQADDRPEAPLPPDTGSGVLAPVTSNGAGIAALALVAAGGAMAGGLLRRRG